MVLLFFKLKKRNKITVIKDEWELVAITLDTDMGFDYLAYSCLLFLARATFDFTWISIQAFTAYVWEYSATRLPWFVYFNLSDSILLQFGIVILHVYIAVSAHAVVIIKKNLMYITFMTVKPVIKIIITKTCLYKFDPLLFLFKNINCGYSLEPPRRCGSNEYPQSIFWAEIWKIADIWKFSFFGGKIFSVFV